MVLYKETASSTVQSPRLPELRPLGFLQGALAQNTAAMNPGGQGQKINTRTAFENSRCSIKALSKDKKKQSSFGSRDFFPFFFFKQIACLLQEMEIEKSYSLCEGSEKTLKIPVSQRIHKGSQEEAGLCGTRVLACVDVRAAQGSPPALGQCL